MGYDCLHIRWYIPDSVYMCAKETRQPFWNNCPITFLSLELQYCLGSEIAHKGIPQK